MSDEQAVDAMMNEGGPVHPDEELATAASNTDARTDQQTMGDTNRPDNE